MKPGPRILGLQRAVIFWPLESGASRGQPKQDDTEEEGIFLDSLPEKRMLMACLMRALGDATGHFAGTMSGRGGRKRVFHEAQRWFLEEISDLEFSFYWVCDALDLPDSRMEFFRDLVRKVTWDDIKDNPR